MQMHEPEQRNSPRVSARRTREASEFESPPTVNTSDSGEEDLEAPGRRHDSTLNERPPPLGVELTGYRLLNTIVILGFGMAKAILTYMGRSAEPTTLEFIGGAVLVVFLYWIGMFEPVCSKKWEWFFQVDLTRVICYWVWGFIGRGTNSRLQDLVVCTHDLQVSEETYSTASALYPSLQPTLVRGHDEGAGTSPNEERTARHFNRILREHYLRTTKRERWNNTGTAFRRSAPNLLHSTIALAGNRPGALSKPNRSVPIIGQQVY